MFDLAGKRLKEVSVGKRTAGEHFEQISLGNVASGVYIVKLTSEEGPAYQKIQILK